MQHLLNLEFKYNLYVYMLSKVSFYIDGVMCHVSMEYFSRHSSIS